MLTIFARLSLLALIVSSSASATDIYVVQGAANGPPLNSGELILWSTDAVFYNAGITDARVRLLGISNGGGGTINPAEFTIPPRRSASLQRLVSAWRPGANDPLWIIHLEVPPEVVADSLLFIGSTTVPGFPAVPITRPFRFGKVRLPVFNALVPAGQPQVHLGTYLGSPSDIPSRINVGIYNGGSVPATARIEIRQQCDDTVVDSRAVIVPADSLIQVTGFQALERNCPPFVPGTLGGSFDAVYTLVTVDLPSLSFVSNLANNSLPLTSMSITPTR